MTTKQSNPKEPKVSIKDLLEAGVHFGHQTHRWNPKMERFIFEERNGIHILDLAKTMHHIRKACEVVRSAVENHKSILFVGTKKQAKTVVQECAEACGEFHVAERWLGGMLTNLATIRGSVKTMDKLEKKLASGGEGLTKKERSSMSKLHGKLQKNLAGIRAMRKPPGLLVVVDPSKEHLAVAEARRLRIPVLAIVDTNCDPDLIDYVIPGNDDALKSNKILLQTLTNIVIDTKKEENIPLTREDKEEAAAKAKKKVSPSAKGDERSAKERSTQTKETEPAEAK